MKSILGNAMFKTSSTEIKTQWTKPFEGCLFVNFDELPVDQSNYKSIGDRTKSLITEPFFDCRKMRQDPYSQTNTFNIMITTNNNAILFSRSNHKRYFLLDVD